MYIINQGRGPLIEKSRLSESVREERPKFRRVNLVGSAVVTLLLLYAVFHDQELSEFLAIFHSIDRSLFLLFVSMSLISVGVRAYRYQLLMTGILGPKHTPSGGKLVIVTALRNALSDSLPARLGELAYVYLVNRLGVPVVTGLSTFGLSFVLDIIVLAGVVAALLAATLAFPGSTAVQVTGLGEVAPGLLVFFIFGLLLIVTAFFVLLKRMNLVLNLLARLSSFFLSEHRPNSVAKRIFEKCYSAVYRIAEDVRLVGSSGRLLSLVTVTLLLRLLKYGSLHILLLAVVTQWSITHRDIGLGTSLLSFLSAEASASLPMSGLLGFGAYEGVWSMVFSSLCKELCAVIPSIPSVALAVHLITQVVAYVVGGIALILFFSVSGISSGRGRKLRPNVV